MTESTQGNPLQLPITAGPGKSFRFWRYIMVVALVGMGGWFLYDGFIAWPEHNRKLAELQAQLRELPDGSDAFVAKNKEINEHGQAKTDFDINLQKMLGFSLPPLAIALLVFWLHRSRGQYRLTEDTLHVPGHPPVPLQCITALDRKHWERKGIMLVRYALPDGVEGELKLDDFIYDAKPTDAIVKVLEERLNHPTLPNEPKA